MALPVAATVKVVGRDIVLKRGAPTPQTAAAEPEA